MVSVAFAGRGAAAAAGDGDAETDADGEDGGLAGAVAAGGAAAVVGEDGAADEHATTPFAKTDKTTTKARGKRSINTPVTDT
jgi:hypothetical protein